MVKPFTFDNLRIVYFNTESWRSIILKFTPLTALAAAGALVAYVGAPASAFACAAAWTASGIYTAGAQASENGIVYKANWWTQNQDPAANNGGVGTGEPWTKVGSCSSCVATPTTPTGVAASATTSSATTLSWNAVTMAACTVTGYDIYQNGALVGASTGPTYAVSGLSPKTTYSFTVAAINSVGLSAKSAPVSVTTSSAGVGSASSGAINFHIVLGAGPAADSLTLTGGNYDDLIMSNIIAGVMYGHIVTEGYPGIRFNKDYLVGSIFGQLLQENIATFYYQAADSRIDPSPNQQAVMGVGQGGPYQINNYAADMVAGGYAPQGHSLINYVAIQKNIGYTIANAATQYARATPASFNNKYYGPMLTAFFHYNDMVALSVTGKGAGGWPTPWEPVYDEALANFDNLPNSFLDVILNAAYNQGYYGPLVPYYSKLGATATATTIANVNSYAQAWGNSDTYTQYPYQVHYYLDQLYDNPVPTTSPSAVTTPANHVVFTMAALQGVFSNVIQTLDYSKGTSAQFFTAAQATAAFASALTSNKVSASAALDLANAASRATIFAVIDSALTNLETATATKFNATTLSQL